MHECKMLQIQEIYRVRNGVFLKKNTLCKHYAHYFEIYMRQSINSINLVLDDLERTIGTILNELIKQIPDQNHH